MQAELRPFGVQVQTINPGAYLTGFNEAMAENEEAFPASTRPQDRRQPTCGTEQGTRGTGIGRGDILAGEPVTVIASSRVGTTGYRF
jgi:NAD(P)-dependent dehydrogenase (short-subunit alcohol dehydrogenase family)